MPTTSGSAVCGARHCFARWRCSPNGIVSAGSDVSATPAASVALPPPPLVARAPTGFASPAAARDCRQIDQPALRLALRARPDHRSWPIVGALLCVSRATWRRPRCRSPARRHCRTPAAIGARRHRGPAAIAPLLCAHRTAVICHRY